MRVSAEAAEREKKQHRQKYIHTHRETGRTHSHSTLARISHAQKGRRYEFLAPLLTILIFWARRLLMLGNRRRHAFWRKKEKSFEGTRYSFSRSFG
jgi:hypothetical protein